MVKVDVLLPGGKQLLNISDGNPLVLVVFVGGWLGRMLRPARANFLHAGGQGGVVFGFFGRFLLRVSTRRTMGPFNL